jgi:hypothetical protein
VFRLVRTADFLSFLVRLGQSAPVQTVENFSARVLAHPDLGSASAPSADFPAAAVFRLSVTPPI